MSAYDLNRKGECTIEKNGRSRPSKRDFHTRSRTVRLLSTRPLPTSLSLALAATTLQARYDASCKRVLSEKVILAWILHTCVPEYKTIAIDKIMNQYIDDPHISTIPVHRDLPRIRGGNTEDKTLFEGTVFFDIFFTAFLPDTHEKTLLLINIEAQNNFHPGYPLLSTMVYNMCREVSFQHGVEFAGSHYENIQKVYSIWICLDPPEKYANTITRFRLTEEQAIGHAKWKEEDYDLLCGVMVCLGGAGHERYEGILRLLDVLFCDEMKESEKKKVLEEDYDIQMSKTMEEEVNTMCDLGSGLAKKHYSNGFNNGFNNGFDNGFSGGQIELIQNYMHTHDLSAEKAMEALGVAQKDRLRYAEMIKKQDKTTFRGTS